MQKHCLAPLRAIIETYDPSLLEQENILSASELHKDYINLLKINSKIPPGLRGQCWEFISLIQMNFRDSVPSDMKKQVQEVSFSELKKYHSQDKNLGAIASIF